MRARIFAEENRKWWTLAAVAFGLFMIMLDNTVVNVALPSIESDLHISDLRARVGRQRLRAHVRRAHAHRRQARRPVRAAADLHRRARDLHASVARAAGSRPSAGFLIGARVVQGVGAALMNPATLSIITATFPPRQRGTAIGIWAGVSAMALAIGPLDRRPDHRATSTGTGSSSSTSRSGSRASSSRASSSPSPATSRRSSGSTCPGSSPRPSASSRSRTR